MKQASSATLESIRQKCIDRKPRLRDEVVSIKSLLMDPKQPGRLVVRRQEGGKESSYAMADRIYNQASAVVYGIPGTYLKKLAEGDHGDPLLAAMNFNHWVGVSKDKEVFLRFERQDGMDEFVRAMLPASWNPIPYEASLETLINKYGSDKEVKVTRSDDSALVIDIVTGKLEYEARLKAKVKDDVEWGMRFRDSDCGLGPLRVCPYTLRLICTNGSVMDSCGAAVEVRHVGRDAKELPQALSSIRQAVEMVGSYADSISNMIVKSQDIVLELSGDDNHPEMAMERIMKAHAITRLEEKYVREAWNIEADTLPDPTAWRLHNAFTRAGTHGEELNIDQQLRLQSVGGRILELAESNYRWN